MVPLSERLQERLGQRECVRQQETARRALKVLGGLCQFKQVHFPTECGKLWKQRNWSVRRVVDEVLARRKKPSALLSHITSMLSLWFLYLEMKGRANSVISFGFPPIKILNLLFKRKYKTVRIQSTVSKLWIK